MSQAHEGGSNPCIFRPTQNAVPLPMLTDGQPDWDRIENDLFCARCGYNLRTLTHPQCPECGLDFDWQEAAGHAARRHEFLFEHNWRTRPIGSWFETLWRSFRPKRFWGSVNLHDPVHIGPLLFLFLTAIPLFAALVSLFAVAGIGGLQLLNQSVNAEWLAQPYKTSTVMPTLIQIQETLQYFWDDFALRPADTCFFLFAPSLLLGTVFALLWSLRQTMGRHRVQYTQLLRVVAHLAQPSAVFMAFWTIGNLAVLQWLLTLDDIPFWYLRSWTWFESLTPATILSFYLSMALKNYLRLPQPRLTAAVAVLVAVSFVFILDRQI